MINLLLLGSLDGFEFVSECLISRAKLDSLLDINQSPFKVLSRFFSLSTEEVSFGGLIINVKSLSGLINGGLKIT
jgi:hypothetical protein